MQITNYFTIKYRYCQRFYLDNIYKQQQNNNFKHSVQVVAHFHLAGNVELSFFEIVAVLVHVKMRSNVKQIPRVSIGRIAYKHHSFLAYRVVERQLISPQCKISALDDVAAVTGVTEQRTAYCGKLYAYLMTAPRFQSYLYQKRVDPCVPALRNPVLHILHPLCRMWLHRRCW